MDPLDFLRVAESLTMGTDEASFRTSIGRSYYGVFIHLRDRLRNQGITISNDGKAHREVPAALSKIGGVAGGLVADLGSLRRSRNKADYRPFAKLEQNHAQSSLLLARDIETRSNLI